MLLIHTDQKIAKKKDDSNTLLEAIRHFRSIVIDAGSRGTTAHAHQCCIFQSYAKTVPSRMNLTMKLTMSEPASMTTNKGAWRMMSYSNSVLVASTIWSSCECPLGLISYLPHAPFPLVHLMNVATLSITSSDQLVKDVPWYSCECSNALVCTCMYTCRPT